MADEKVSVIVPVYNVEKYLRRCLDSIINQTYRNLEIILVDDGSPDNCGAICDEYAETDDRISVIHKSNGGVSSARNVAIMEATGKYIVFVDSDDSILPNYIVNLMVCGDADYVAAGCRVQNTKLEWDEWKNQAGCFTLDEIKNVPEKINFIPMGMVWAHRFKREIILRNRLLFRSDITRGEDTLFNSCYVTLCDAIVVTDHTDYLYYLNDSSATTKLNTNLFRWSMESTLAIGEIIGTDSDVFYGRVWKNAMTVCDNYFETGQVASWNTKRQMVQAVFEVCLNPYVRRSLAYAKQNDNKKKAFLVQFCLYPFLPLLYGVYSGIRSLIKKG